MGEFDKTVQYWDLKMMERYTFSEAVGTALDHLAAAYGCPEREGGETDQEYRVRCVKYIMDNLDSEGNYRLPSKIGFDVVLEIGED